MPRYQPNLTLCPEDVKAIVADESIAAQEVISEYRRLEAALRLDSYVDRVTYDAPVNFNESMKHPRHRWFPYKEGFSPSFVRSFITRFNTEKNVRILDPFAGVGTTVIEACLTGSEGVGFEINPLACFIAETKAISISGPDALSELQNTIKRFAASRLLEIAPPPGMATVITYFESAYLEALLRVKAFVAHLPSGDIQKLFKLAFLNLIEHYSTHRKAGNGLKRKTRIGYHQYPGDAVTQVKASMTTLLQLFRDDLSILPKVAGAKFIPGSSLEMESTASQTFDTVLTSPPYANCFDYSKIYMCELWLGDFFTSRDCQKDFRMKSVRSHVHATWPERNREDGSHIVNDLIYPILRRSDLWSKLIPDMLRGYFMDLGSLFGQLHPRLKAGSPVGFVVSNSVYGGIPIATDLLLAETATAHGFEVDRIEVYRRMVPSSQQYVQLANKDYLRESLVVMRAL